MVNLEDFKYGGTNLTAFRLLDPERPEVKQVVEDWIYGEMRYGRKLDTSTMSVKVNKFSVVALSICFSKFGYYFNVLIKHYNFSLQGLNQTVLKVITLICD